VPLRTRDASYSSTSKSASLDPTGTVEQLLVILDRADVLHALGRVKGCRATPLVDVRTNRPASVAHLPAPSIVTAPTSRTVALHPDLLVDGQGQVEDFQWVNPSAENHPLARCANWELGRVRGLRSHCIPKGRPRCSAACEWIRFAKTRSAASLAARSSFNSSRLFR